MFISGELNSPTNNMEWKTVKLGDITELVIDYRGKTPLKLGGDWSDSGYRALSAKNIKTGRIVQEDSIRFIDEALYKKWMKDEVKRGDIFVTSEAPFGEIYYWDSDEKIVLSQRLFDVRINSENDSRFVYYIMTTPAFKAELDGRATGTTVVGLRQPELLKCELSLPPLETQRRIAAILSSLDDKIENNNRINRNLEEQAQALFKSWFVDFEPWGGTMPEDWKEDTIGGKCTCYLGGTPSRAKSEYWNGDIPWINSGEVNKFRIIEGSEYITELGLKKSATKLLPKKTTVLAITGATLGQVSLLEIEACANQSVIGILENEKMPYEFIYPLIVNDIEKIILNQTGGAQQHINKDNVESHNIIIPTDEIMAKYKAIQAPLFETIANNCLESQRLATLRDTLLPKLMRGEIAL